MHFAARAFQLAKDPDQPAENQDHWAADPERGIAVIADGVSSALFSGPWARILFEAVRAVPPNTERPEEFAVWLGARRETWDQSIDKTGLAWFQKAKLPLGAFSTLLWVEVQPRAKAEPGQFGARQFDLRSIGDSCFFHVRHGEMLRSFPIEDAAALQTDPLALGSVDLKRDDLIRFDRAEGLCYEDDLLVLATDAVAEWVLREDRPVVMDCFHRWWDFDEPAWRDEIEHLRAEGRMRYDDATLVLLRISAAAQAHPVCGETQPRSARQPQDSPDGPPSSAPGEPRLLDRLRAASEAVSAHGAPLIGRVRDWWSQHRKSPSGRSLAPSAPPDEPRGQGHPPR